MKLTKLTVVIPSDQVPAVVGAIGDIAISATWGPLSDDDMPSQAKRVKGPAAPITQSDALKAAKNRKSARVLTDLAKTKATLSKAEQHAALKAAGFNPSGAAPTRTLLVRAGLIKRQPQGGLEFNRAALRQHGML